MFNRGSEWKKWDLQVHTPYSVLNNQFGNDWNFYVKNLINKAIKNDIAVVGITDYYSVNGYKTLLEILNDEIKLSTIFQEEIANDKEYLDKIHQIKFFPCIEFRFQDVVENHGHDNKIEANIIFSDEFSSEDLINKFLNNVQFLNENNEESSLTDYNITNFGKKMKEVQPEFASDSDYVAGLKCLTIDFIKTIRILESNSDFKDKYVIIIPEDDITEIDWSSPSHMTRKKYYKKAHGIFTVNNKTVKWGMEENTKNEFNGYKPCFSCSDCHSIEDLFKFKSNKICWIKADNTFNGLKQVFFQPTERLYIGDLPPKLQQVANHKFYYMDQISILKNAKAKNKDNWFNSTIPLNPGLITIIGNKGSGKSALADIIGYMSNSENMNKASFLTKERFRKEDKKYADDYQAILSWKDGRTTNKATLNEEITDIQSAEYLPQKFIEELCNELNDKFQEEIDKVIFSYIDLADKNQCTNLHELIAKKTTAIDYEIKKYRGDIETINKHIISLEEKYTKKYKEDIQSKLNKLEELLESNQKSKPKTIPKPVDVQNGDEIEGLNKKILEIEKQIEQKQSEKLNINIKIDKILQFQEKYHFCKKELENIIDEGTALFKDLDIKENFNVQIVSNFDFIEKKLQELQNQKQRIEKELNESEESDDTTILYIQKKKLINEKESILLTAHESQIKYQKYLEEIKEWETEKQKIVGTSSSDENTISYYKNELQFVNERLHEELETQYKLRRNIVEKIYNSYLKKVVVYKELYKPVEEKLRNILVSNSENIEFETVISINNTFKDEFITYIRQNVESQYKGKVEGVEFLNSAIREVDFNTLDGLKKFVEKIQLSISSDKDNIKKLISNPLSCYNLLNKIEYLNISFTLKMDGKNLNELSPGQRGNVLLIFYLALSKNSEPIIIDQPEDNLDNQSVFDKLVPCILEAKKHRQVIIVTHNPNIAIACDAEQIICSFIDKTDNRISYLSGSIENEAIRKCVIDILEGTMPAFTLRRLKYFE